MITVKIQMGTYSLTWDPNHGEDLLFLVLTTF
jgi:hypothetical protein